MLWGRNPVRQLGPTRPLISRLLRFASVRGPTLNQPLVTSTTDSKTAGPRPKPSNENSVFGRLWTVVRLRLPLWGGVAIVVAVPVLLSLA